MSNPISNENEFIYGQNRGYKSQENMVPYIPRQLIYTIKL